MNETTTVWDLCQQTFGSIPARWRPVLERMEARFTPQQLQEAFSRTKEHGGKSIRYTEEIAEGLRTEALAVAPVRTADESHAYCEACNRPKWLNELRLSNGMALCGGCLPAQHQSALLYRASARAYPHVHHLPEALDYVPTDDELAADKMQRKEIRLLPDATLRWWAAQPSCFAYPGRRRHLEAEFKRRRIAVEVPTRLPITLTPAAQRVSAYWDGVECAS